MSADMRRVVNTDSIGLSLTMHTRIRPTSVGLIGLRSPELKLKLRREEAIRIALRAQGGVDMDFFLVSESLEGKIVKVDLRFTER